jgi:50S ribosomal protein L16 3-hydroxylase
MKPNRRLAQRAYPHLLGDLSPAEFLRDYWQKKPLLVRGAVPGFGSDLDKKGMLELASRDDVESRFVSTGGGVWQLEHGPFSAAQARRWKNPWSILVQGVNLLLPMGENLIRAFDFIPYARLDDLMVSYATDGGGVGPHFDNYDVFLLQGSGQRRWRIGRQKDQTLVEDLTLRILKNFKPTHEWVLEPGDMLYLPPDWAHDGIAEGECMTWSIGFRAPPVQELADLFLTYLQDNLQLDGIYRDPDLTLQKHPAEISSMMITRVSKMLEQIRWTPATVRDFLGSALTEPKPQVYFEPPARPMSATQFQTRIQKRGLRLDARTQMLFSSSYIYLNGTEEPVPAPLRKLCQTLADQRYLEPEPDLAKAAELLYAWYCDGYLHLG